MTDTWIIGLLYWSNMDLPQGLLCRTWENLCSSMNNKHGINWFKQWTEAGFNTAAVN